MSEQTSEQALSALEHSTKPAVELLNDAAKIIGLDLERPDTRTGYQPTSAPRLDIAGFRRQWVLRWLTKRLAHATNPKAKRQPQDEDLLLEQRTWVLLRCLLYTIPQSSMRAILVERGFCSTFDACLKSVLQQQDETLDTNSPSSTQSADHETGRPTKKRKIAVLSQTERASSPETRFRRLLDIAAQAAHILKQENDIDGCGTARAPANWVDNVEAAASLIGSLLQVADRALKCPEYENGPNDVNLISLMLVDWLELWQLYISTTYSSSKRDPHAAFNRHILVPALTLLQHKSRFSGKMVSTTLERQIAIHSILPSRAVFQEKHASKWKTWMKEPAEAEIMPVIQEVVLGFGPAAEAFSFVGGEVPAALLLGIAARLVPRSDVVMRREEKSWLEALFMSLSYLLDPYKLDGTDGVQSGNQGRAPAVTASTTLLHTVQGAAVQPSHPVFRFYVRQAIFRSRTDVTYNVLSKVVSLNPVVFLPESSEEGNSLLEELGTLVEEHPPTSADQHDQLVQEIIVPIMEEIGKSRKVSAFITFWQTMLINTFHDRVSSTTEPAFKGQKHVWDDPNILGAFSSICQRYATPSICRDMLSTIMTDMEELPTLVGPTYEIFARSMICIEMLKAQKSAHMIQVFLSERAGQLRGVICAALSRSNDYQGQRWLLWKLLGSLAVPVALIDFDQPLDLHQVSGPLSYRQVQASKDVRAPEVRADLMEQLHCFSAICALHEENVVGSKTLFDKGLSDLNLMMEKHLESGPFDGNAESSWTGSVDDMDNVETLLSAILQRLAAVPISWLSDYNASHQLLINAVCLILYPKGAGNNEDQGPSCGRSSAEALLDSVSASSDVDLVDIYLDAAKQNHDQNQVKRPPSFISGQSQFSMNKGQARKLSKALLLELQERSKHMSHAELADYLSLLSTIVDSHAEVLASNSTFESFIPYLEVSTNGASLEALASASQSISKIAGVLVRRALADVADDQRGVLDWARRRIKKADSRKYSGIADQYDWFALLAVVEVIRSLENRDQTHGQQKLTVRLEQRYRDMAVATCELLCSLEQSTKSESVGMDKDTSFKAWSLIETLLCLDENKSPNTETIRLLGKLLPIGDLDSDIYARLLNRLGNATRREDVDMVMKVAVDRLNPKSEQPLRHESAFHQASIATFQEVNQQLFSKKHYLDMVRDAKLDRKEHYLPASVIQNYLVATGYVRSLKPDELASSPELLSTIGKIASLDYGVAASSTVTLIARLELSKIIFETHPAMINQNIIDKTLTSIALLTSSASERTLDNIPTSPQPHHIYNCICTLILTLLTRHRRRLTDRHNILIPALQNLLKCLFYPPTRAPTTTRDTYPSKAAFLDSLPPWLNPPSHTSTTTLPPTSASRLSRVLQTLCDPSTSAARHTKKRPNKGSNLNLTDETRQLRQQVSLHTQYLLITYTQATLDGYISPEVKEKLLPGLYSVLNATDVEVMRAMNASMEVSQREVWKDLYADWGRYGRWNRK
ncbi:hypothetical protein LTR70_003039 [Exophiala xenobiotica]|uniref:Nucleolar 27S pre-rRNA processing Urb2/Npa2 C-terminal domain-containing protein n=1 Tax=Lithohypha guttulata TaxID=1690604 RepID=A0ABR0K8D8_9EURO|nr:hypothetical protein LTR24_005719 [Lithohypha guttulata]KAK5324409.1 hypothetical protein LTR70_003039 [Exophiala xenobiotica]